MKRILTGFLLVFLFLQSSYGQQTYANFAFDVVCEGDSTTLVSTSTHLPGDSIVQYLWDTTWNNGQFDWILAGPQIRVKLPASGVYEIGHKIYTKNNLMESIYKQVPVSKVTADFASSNFCLGDLTQFSDLSTTENSSIVNWLWDFGDTYASAMQNPGHPYAAFGIYTVSLTVTTVNGCIDTEIKTITINDNPHFTLDDGAQEPVAVIGGVKHYEFYEDLSLTMTANITSDYTLVTWTKDGAAISNALSITITETGFYTCEVENAFGCKTAEGFSVTVVEDRLVQPIPVMTPNGDGSNDFFKIKRYILSGDKYELKIFNRYGNEVYSSSNYQNDWDGKNDGDLVPAGPYYYFLKDQSGMEWKGALNIVYGN